jgi:hypothetical protein
MKPSASGVMPMAPVPTLVALMGSPVVPSIFTA